MMGVVSIFYVFNPFRVYFPVCFFWSPDVNPKKILESQILHVEISNGHSCGRCLALHFEQKMVLVAKSSLFFFV